MSHLSSVFIFLSQLVFELLFKTRVDLSNTFNLLLNLLHLLILQVKSRRHLLNSLPLVLLHSLHLCVNPCLLVLQLFVFVFQVDKSVSKPLYFTF